MAQVLSCIQPTGNLHFGRYFGAVKNYVDLQVEHDCIYGVVDYHAMTMPFAPDKLRISSWDIAFNLLACGVRMENLFIQSLIPEHTELNWIFNCVASYGEVTRMTQFKDKSQQSKEQSKDNFVSVGLFTYPVLQAADILIYKATHVPVGKDQEQHLELSRDIAQKFNNLVKKEYFLPPQPLYTATPKVMSTADPTRKMSASAGEKHNINVFSDPERILKQIRSAVTDTGESSGDEMSPGVANLFEMLKASGSSEAHQSLMDDYRSGSLRYVDLKDATGKALVTVSTPLREAKETLLADKKAVKNQIKYASSQIRLKAQETLKEVKELVGLLNVKF